MTKVLMKNGHCTPSHTLYALGRLETPTHDFRLQLTWHVCGSHVSLHSVETGHGTYRIGSTSSLARLGQNLDRPCQDPGQVESNWFNPTSNMFRPVHANSSQVKPVWPLRSTHKPGLNTINGRVESDEIQHFEP